MLKEKKVTFLLCFILLNLIIFSINAESNSMKEENIILPKPKNETPLSLEKCISQRRSVRNFSSKEINKEQISLLLWAAQGITDKDKNYRAAPSAGATYPLELYLFNSTGVYHYIPEKHKLTQKSSEDLRSELSGAALNQGSISSAPVTIVICAVPERTMSVYGERGKRYIFMEAGHVAENIHLEAESLGLDSVPVGAFKDSQVEDLLNLPDKENPLYIIPVGYKK